ncbi:MAG TPA: hypothetical protein VEZ88_10175 [Steroidobacteraceae bacterium]|nr:hypothetical protein [Steroidobacteraceae bacterium]
MSGSMFKAGMLLLLLMAAVGVHAQEMDTADLEGRIEYAYFTADANALRNLVSTMQNSLAKGDSSPLAHYERGLAQYRLGQVLATAADSGAAAAFANCSDALGKSIDADKQFAEAYALQSACYTSRAQINAWKGVVDLPLGGSRLDKALKLAPSNPRVALIDALNDYDRPRAFGGDRTQACTKFAHAAKLFEAVANDASRTPGWGAADTYLHVGRCLRESGDVLGARNALERALIIAPDFAAARDELRRVVAGS